MRGARSHHSTFRIQDRPLRSNDTAHVVLCVLKGKRGRGDVPILRGERLLVMMARFSPLVCLCLCRRHDGGRVTHRRNGGLAEATASDGRRASGGHTLRVSGSGHFAGLRTIKLMERWWRDVIGRYVKDTRLSMLAPQCTMGGTSAQARCERALAG